MLGTRLEQASLTLSRNFWALRPQNAAELVQIYVADSGLSAGYCDPQRLVDSFGFSTQHPKEGRLFLASNSISSDRCAVLSM